MKNFPTTPFFGGGIGPGFFAAVGFFSSDPGFFVFFLLNPRVSLTFGSLVDLFARITWYGCRCSVRVETNHRKATECAFGIGAKSCMGKRVGDR